MNFLFTSSCIHRVKVHCWDTAGQEKYRTLSAMTFLFRRIDCVIVMFDVASEQSFRNVRRWLQELEDVCPESTAKLLVGNKCDLPEANRQVILTKDIIANDFS